MADHFLDLTIRDGAIDKRFRCTAGDRDDVVTSPCRWFCATCEEECSCGVEMWTNHLEYCRETEGWFDSIDVEEAYDGEDNVPFRSGLVEFTWNGDTYCWHYAPEREPDEPLFVLGDAGQIVHEPETSPAALADTSSIYFCGICLGAGIVFVYSFDSDTTERCDACGGTGHLNVDTGRSAAGPCAGPGCVACHPEPHDSAEVDRG